MKPFIRPLSEIFSECGVQFSESSSGEIILDKCFNCGRKKKLYVSAENGSFNCFRCQIKGREEKGILFLLTRTLGINYYEANELLFGKQKPQSIKPDDDDDDLQVHMTGFKRTKAQKKELPKPIKFPSYIKPLIKSDIDAINYLKKRGLPESITMDLGLYHWASAKRVVFPVTFEGELYGYLSRDYIGDQDKKVLNSHGIFRSFTFWNYDIAKESAELVICEGVMSAIKCGPQRSIALLGKTATHGQIDLIRSMAAKKIYICLDVGTDKDQYEIYQKLSLYYPGKIYQVVMPPILLLKCPHCGKKFEYDERVSFMDGITCSHCQFKLNRDDFQKLKKKSEYKDAGDYSFEEMDEMIKSAKPYPGGPMCWEL